MPRDDNAPTQAEHAMGAPTEDGESDEEEADEQPGFARADQGGGERRPRRRGRRGGRRRRGGMDDGLAGSVSDEFAPPSASEAESAVADLDGSSVAPSLPEVQPEPGPPAVEPQLADHEPPEAVRPPAETTHEGEKAAPRRSTVREKVSFLSAAQPDTTPVQATPAEPSPASSPPEPTAEPASEAAPRRAGWWSRRFSGGE